MENFPNNREQNVEFFSELISSFDKEFIVAFL